MNKDTFSYHLTKYFAEYLPVRIGASPNTIRSYRDVFVQLMEYYKSEYRLPPEKLEYKDFTAARIEGFLGYLESMRGIGINTRNQRLAAIHAFFRYLQYRNPAGFGQCAEVSSVLHHNGTRKCEQTARSKHFTILWRKDNASKSCHR